MACAVSRREFSSFSRIAVAVSCGAGAIGLKAALRVQAYTTEMHRMAGVVAAMNKSSMTDAEKLEATDAVTGSMLAVAKLGQAAMQASKKYSVRR
jgi:hypothetical protein